MKTRSMKKRLSKIRLEQINENPSRDDHLNNDNTKELSHAEIDRKNVQIEVASVP